MQSHEPRDKYGLWIKEVTPQQQPDATGQDHSPENPPPTPPYTKPAVMVASSEPGTEYWLP
jgi:hypothetical protein